MGSGSEPARFPSSLWRHGDKSRPSSWQRTTNTVPALGWGWGGAARR